MREKFIEAINESCRTRSERSTTVRWWFARTRVAVHRVHAPNGFGDEGTLPFGVLQQRLADSRRG